MITSKTVIETKDEFLRKAMYEVFGGEKINGSRALRCGGFKVLHFQFTTNV